MLSLRMCEIYTVCSGPPDQDTKLQVADRAQAIIIRAREAGLG